MRLDTLRVKLNSFSKKVMIMALTVLTPVIALAADVIEPPKEQSIANWDWVAILTWLLVLLVILVIARAFDIGALTEKITGKKVISWNNINAWVAIIFLIAGLAGVWYELVYHGKYLMLGNAASAHGGTYDSMFYWTFGFTFFVFVVTEVLLFYFMFKYRYNENRKAHYYFHNNKLEIIWTIVPSIVLTFLVLRGFTTWSTITGELDKESEEIEVFAYQFGWKARYAGDDQVLGYHNVNFISGTNPLGIAETNAVNELVAELEGEIDKLEGLQESEGDSIKAWSTRWDRMKSTGLFRTYPEDFKTLDEKVHDGMSGAYGRQLEKDIKRKKTALRRIAEYQKDKDFFNGTANDDKVTTEIVLVKNKPYVFKFRARDVIHSAYMPDFRVQMNCVPGMPTQFAFTPTMTTAEAREVKANNEYDYYLFCNKICGAAHYNMKIKVTVVESEAEYNTWYASQAPFVAPTTAQASEPTVEEVVPAADSTQVVIDNQVAINK
ncbi:MAG: cytochrome c oxidase subunit II transmembrane domain-containing protein [Bacteroidia bacterium]